MKKSKLIIVSFLVAVSLLLIGCDSMTRSNYVYFDSLYTGESVTFKVTANKWLQGQWGHGRAFYHTRLSKAAALKEIKNNKGVEFVELCGYNFIRFSGEVGIYNIYITDSTRKGYKSSVTISDMRLELITNPEANSFNDRYTFFPFPYIIFDDEYYMNREISSGADWIVTYEKDTFIELLYALDIYEIEEDKDSISLTFNDTTLNVKFTKTGLTFTF